MIPVSSLLSTKHQMMETAVWEGILWCWITMCDFNILNAFLDSVEEKWLLEVKKRKKIHY